MATNLESRIVRPRPVRQAKPPSMPGASDRAIFKIASAQRRSHVRAKVVDGNKLAVLFEECHRLGPNLDRDPLPFSNIRHLADVLKVAHARFSVYTFLDEPSEP